MTIFSQEQTQSKGSISTHIAKTTNDQKTNEPSQQSNLEASLTLQTSQSDELIQPLKPLLPLQPLQEDDELIQPLKPLLPLQPLQEDDEYEDPLFEFLCLEIYWSTAFSEFCSRKFNWKLKHASKKGTSAWKRKRPVTEGHIMRTLKKLVVHTRKEKKKFKKEWESRRLSIWTYQVRIKLTDSR